MQFVYRSLTLRIIRNVGLVLTVHQFGRVWNSASIAWPNVLTLCQLGSVRNSADCFDLLRRLLLLKSMLVELLRQLWSAVTLDGSITTMEMENSDNISCIQV